MDLFRRLFQKSAPRGLFSFAFPMAPASVQNPDYLLSYRGWVYACVKRIAQSIATTELTLQQRVGDEWKEVRGGPQMAALDLLSRVNPFMTSDALLGATSSFLDLTGNAFWLVVYDNRHKPTELWLLDPTKVEVRKHPTDFIDGYRYFAPNGRWLDFGIDEIIPFQEFRPEDPYKGKGPVEAAALSIDQDRYASEYNRNFFANGGMPSTLITTKQNLTQEQYDRLIEGWMARFSGVQNAHKPGVLEGDTDVKTLSTSQKDMDFATLKQNTRDEILAIFGVPKSILGVVQDVNRANAETSEYTFAKYTIAPRMRFLATTLSEFYLPMWGMQPTEYRLWAKDVVPQNDELKTQRRASAIQNGYLTINEARVEDGLKPLEGGDTPLIATTLQTLDRAINPPPPPTFGPPAAGDQNPANEPPAVPNPANDQPPKKALSKAAAPTLVAGRVTFVVDQIVKAEPKYAALFTSQKRQLVTRMSEKSASRILTNRKDHNETELSNELVRFLFQDWNDWIGLLLNPTRETLTASFDEAGRQALAEVATDLTFNQEHARAIGWLQSNALNHATSIADTVKGDITDLIVSGVQDGLGAQAIADSISGYFTENTDWKALMIARTEVISGYAQGSLEGYRQSGVVERKQWLTAGDDRVEEECAANEDAGPIPLDQNFPDGSDAPPVHQNCRCVIQPVVDEG